MCAPSCMRTPVKVCHAPGPPPGGPHLSPLSPTRPILHTNCCPVLSPCAPHPPTPPPPSQLRPLPFLAPDPRPPEPCALHLACKLLAHAASMQACSLSQHVLQGRPAVGEVPLLSCVVQGGGDTCRGGWGKIEEELLNERSASACPSSQLFFAKLWPAAVSRPPLQCCLLTGSQRMKLVLQVV
jgi:hypothetical protein